MDALLEQVGRRLNDLRSQYEKAAGQKELLERQRTERCRQLERTRNDVQVWQQVQALFTKTSEFAREQLKLRIEQTVTAALQAVFEDESLSFRVEMKTFSGNPAAEWVVSSVYGDVTVDCNPEDSRGGGITDVVSLALRLALLELSRPKVEGPVILDEPGKMISREYLPNVAEFLKQYGEKTGRQIMMVTHAEPLAEVADCSYRVGQKEGISEVSRG